MKVIAIPPDFAAWRDQARALLRDGIPPSETGWQASESGQADLFAAAESSPPAPTHASGPVPAVPKAFLDLAETVACHRDETRWGLLYSLLWRLTRGDERHLLKLRTDREIDRAHRMAKEIGRDIHKMRAFVRFREIENSAEENGNGRESFVAWFEPDHHIVRRNAPFFQKRFTNMNWSILTPDECVHWDGNQLRFTPGLPRSAAPDEDDLETLWLTYYRNIFNPSRLKLKAMQAEMPVKYWKNLPEAPVIRELTIEASQRRESMIARPGLPAQPAPEKNRYLQGLHARNEISPLDSVSAEELEEATIDELRDLAACCRACPLWDRATQTVFGVGNPKAELMIIGEQPGDQEDIEGQPFVGPAGRLLDEALAKAGIDRGEVYLTNAVKHFKWKAPNPSTANGRPPRGPRRLHDKANRKEQETCRPWLMAEIAKVMPRVILTLGATAAGSVIRPGFSVTAEHGEVAGPIRTPFDGRVFATVHPSYLLRLRDAEQKAQAFQDFVADLQTARMAIAS